MVIGLLFLLFFLILIIISLRVKFEDHITATKTGRFLRHWLRLGGSWLDSDSLRRFYFELVLVPGKCGVLVIGLAALRQHAILLIKGLGQFIATELHLLELMIFPSVHFQGAHKGNVHAHAPVVSSALIAEENANVGRAPFGILAAAIETGLDK